MKPKWEEAGQEMPVAERVPRPVGTKLIYTCNTCGKQAWSKAWVQIHCYRQHGVEDRANMDIIKRPMFQSTSQKEKRAIEEFIDPKNAPKKKDVRECPRCGKRFWSFAAQERHVCK